MIIDDGRVLHLEANEAGEGLLRYEPELGGATRPTDVYAYPHLEDGFVRAVAEFSEAPVEAVTAIGSAFQQLEQVAHFSDASDIVVLENDFRGYHVVARRRGLPVVKIPARTGDDPGIYERLASAVRMLRHPLAFLTIGTSNPLQTAVDAVLAISAIHAANPRTVIVLDTAYIDYCGIEHRQMAKLALELPGVVVVNPCSKSHFIAGGAVGWMITGDSILDRFARLDDFPFRAPGVGCRTLARLLAMPGCIARARAHVREARDMNYDTLCRYGGAQNVIGGPGPWTLWYAGDRADAIIRALKAENVLVQQQGGGSDTLSSYWIRVSATVPDESAIFESRLERAMSNATELQLQI